MQEGVVRNVNGILVLIAGFIIFVAVSAGLELPLIAATLVAIVYNQFKKVFE